MAKKPRNDRDKKPNQQNGPPPSAKTQMAHSRVVYLPPGKMLSSPKPIRKPQAIKDSGLTT
jgi:hypothetical protein